jgi:hypothetical protein
LQQGKKLTFQLFGRNFRIYAFFSGRIKLSYKLLLKRLQIIKAYKFNHANNMKSLEKPLMFAVAAMALVSAFAVMAITSADQAQATGTKPYKYYVKLLNGNKLIGQVVKVTVNLFDNSGKIVASASKLVTIKDNSVTVPITVYAPIDVTVNFGKSCVQIANVASNVICAKNSPVRDVNNVSLELDKIYIKK